MEWFILLFIGLFTGAFGSLVGLGGGIIMVPSLLYLNSSGLLSDTILPEDAVGISLVVIVISAISSSIYYYKEGKIDVKSGLFFFSASGVTTILGSIATSYINIKAFYIFFGLLMIFITFLLSKKNTKPSQERKFPWDVQKVFINADGSEVEYGYNKKIAFLITAFAGFIGGVFGIGGGAIFVPMMVILFRFPPHIATATSMFIILLSTSIGSMTHIILGNVKFMYVLMLAPGAYIGGKIGSNIAKKISSQGLIKLLRIVIILVAIQMIYKGL